MIDTTNMTKKSRYLYETMWGNLKSEFPVVNTNGNSVNSYSFTNISTTCENACSSRLIELFEITDKDLFKEKFHQACGGSGNEIQRIGTLHSSALCALLFFYNVTENHPLTLTVEGKECIFIHSRFEFKNPVIKNPSNMDVTLVGRYADTGKPVILFLESKFSEYMERFSTKLDISNGYLSNRYSKDIYRSKLDDLGITITEHPDKNEFTIESTEPCYLEGIKQMISHFIGVNNFMDTGPATYDPLISYLRKDAYIYLGTILFDKGIGHFEITDGVTCYESYKERYKTLADILNKAIPDKNKKKLHVIKELFSYTMFENSDFVKEDKIKKFYFELGK